MPLTPLQRDICRLLARDRRARGESYVAGGAALTVALDTQRYSRDLDLFHDTAEAVARSWERDRALLVPAGYVVDVVRERPGYVEAAISRRSESVVAEWAHDSAFRFFPLVEHEELGLTLHPFDLATNKVLALVGRLEPRDWIDVLACDERLQPLGYLAWAAAGKDPGFTPPGIVEQARRSSRYSQDELSPLAFEGQPPDAAQLGRLWHRILSAAETIIPMLPAPEVGSAVLTLGGELFTGGAAALGEALAQGRLLFHRGRLGGAFPTLKVRR